MCVSEETHLKIPILQRLPKLILEFLDLFLKLGRLLVSLHVGLFKAHPEMNDKSDMKILRTPLFCDTKQKFTGHCYMM